MNELKKLLVDVSSTYQYGFFLFVFFIIKRSVSHTGFEFCFLIFNYVIVKLFMRRMPKNKQTRTPFKIIKKKKKIEGLENPPQIAHSAQKKFYFFQFKKIQN